MCRLFGFRASIPSKVHRALVSESNALRHQSQEHRDGWGVAYYRDGQPHVSRSITGAFEDEGFAELSSFISSDTVVAHVRKASVGPLSIENTHPFGYGPWVLAHNGTVPKFDALKDGLEAECAPRHRERLSGDTDSERLFALLLTRLELRCDPLAPDVPLPTVFEAMDETVRLVMARCAHHNEDPSLNLVLTNGRIMAAFRHGRSLFHSTYKTECPERTTCGYFTGSCESAVSEEIPVNHFLVASEIIGGPNVWTEIPENQFIGVDDQMKVRRRWLSGHGPKLAMAG